MGHNARATVVFGVDLGDDDYREDYVEVPGKYLEDGLSEGLEDLFTEYRGWSEPPLHWVSQDVDPAGYAAWDQQLDRKSAFLKAHPTAIGYSSYGYEYSGTVVSSAVAGTAEWGASPVQFGETNEAELEKFLQFLESKGFKFNPDKRKAQWLVTATYG